MKPNFTSTSTVINMVLCLPALSLWAGSLLGTGAPSPWYLSWDWAVVAELWAELCEQ